MEDDDGDDDDDDDDDDPHLASVIFWKRGGVVKYHLSHTTRLSIT